MKSEIENTRLLDWVVFGTYWRDRLLFRETTEYDYALNEASSVEAFELDFTFTSESAIPLEEFLSSKDVRDEDRWTLLKQLSVGLRYVFLQGRDVSDAVVTVHLDDTPKPSRLIVCLNDGTTMAVRSVIRPTLDIATRYVLQGGNRNSWFNMSDWQRLCPIGEVGNEGQFSGSQPAYYDPEFDDLLNLVGAIDVGGSYWKPPPATYSEDLFGYVRNLLH